MVQTPRAMTRLWLALVLVPLLVSAALADQATKFARVERFSRHLPELRTTVQARLQQPKLDRATAVAAIVRIMDSVYMRVGSDRYANKKDPTKKSTYGAATLLKQHVQVQGDTVRFEFRGKSGVHWQRTLTDPQLARTIKLFQSQPGERLFQVPNDGQTSKVTAAHVRGFLSGFGALPKDFRTLHANRLLGEELSRMPRPGSRTQAEHNLTGAVKKVAKQLGHTPSVCRSNYLDGRRLEAYAAGLQ